MLADLFSSVTRVPACADQASPVLYSFRSTPILYVTLPSTTIVAMNPMDARSARQPDERSATCCTISTSAGRAGRGNLASYTIVGSNGESCTAVVCGAPGGNRKLVRRRALPGPVLPAAWTWPELSVQACPARWECSMPACRRVISPSSTRLIACPPCVCHEVHAPGGKSTTSCTSSACLGALVTSNRDSATTLRSAGP